MDSYDLFKKLTRGVRFTTKAKIKTTIKKSIVGEEKQSANITEQLCNTNSLDEQFSREEEELEADKNEDEEESFRFVSGVASPKEVRKKRKKRQSKNFNESSSDKLFDQEMTLRLRKENKISVWGKNVPPPIQTFDELRITYNVSERLVNNLLNCSYSKPTPIQMQAIPIMLSGRPLMACAPTGSGKTLAFLTPVIHDLKGPKKVGFRALILAPTRELAKQIYRECVRLSEKTALKVHIISKVNQEKQKFNVSNSKKFDVLISTPNRVRYLLQQEPPLLDLKSVEWFIIDEADRLMEEGQNNFKEQLDDILEACTNSNKKLALFSATSTIPVVKWAVKNLKKLVRVTIGAQNAATEFVDQELLFVGSESGKLLAIRDLVRKGLKPPVLIFVQSKDRAKQLFQELLYDGINVDVIHADRTQQQRDNCVRAFREGHIWILICTELMSRGIDFKGVNLVINYDFPPSKISYVHRIGRTGRAGRRGQAITFFTQNDTEQLRNIAEIITNSGGIVPEFMLNMKKLSKSEKKKFANYAPKRDDILTKIKPQIKNPHEKSQIKEEKTITGQPKKRKHTTTNEDEAVTSSIKKVKKPKELKKKFKNSKNCKE